MKVYGLNISDAKGLTNIELEDLAQKLGINNFRGVFMRDTLPQRSFHQECAIVNLNTSKEPGSHWICYF